MGHHGRDNLLYFLCLLAVHLTACVTSRDHRVRDHNPGDRYGHFVHSMPELFRNSTVGPDVWNWLAERFGLAHLILTGVRKAPNNSHVCARDRGWCREECRPYEVIAWPYKDICGKYYCCVPNIQRRPS